MAEGPQLLSLSVGKLMFQNLVHYLLKVAWVVLHSSSQVFQGLALVDFISAVQVTVGLGRITEP